MADPFEVRMRFTNQLRQLNASVTSAQKAAQYALKNREMAEDLHSCILEQLGRVSLSSACYSGGSVNRFDDALEQHEHPGQYHVFYRTLLGLGQ